MKKKISCLISLAISIIFAQSCFPNLPVVSKDGNIIALCLNIEGGYYLDHWEYGRDKNHNTVLYTRDLFLFDKTGEKCWRVTDLDAYVSFPNFGYNQNNKRPDKLLFVNTPSEDFPRRTEVLLQDSLIVIQNIEEALQTLENLPTISRKHLKLEGRLSEPLVVYTSSIEPRGYILFPEFSQTGSKIAFVETQNFPTNANIRNTSYSGELKIVNLTVPRESELRVLTIAKNAVPKVRWLDDETLLFPRITGEISEKFTGSFSVQGEIIKFNLKDKSESVLWKGNISRFLVNIAVNDKGQIAFDSTTGFTSRTINKIYFLDNNSEVSEIASGNSFGLPQFLDNKLIFYAPEFEGNRISKVALGSMNLDDAKRNVKYIHLPASINLAENYRYWLNENYVFTKFVDSKTTAELAGNDLFLLGTSEDSKETDFMRVAQRTVLSNTPDKRMLISKAQEKLGLVSRTGSRINIRDSVSILDVTFYEYKEGDDGNIQTSSRRGTYIEIVQMPELDASGNIVTPGKIRTEQNIIGSGNEIKCWDGSSAYVLTDKFEKYDPSDRTDMIKRGAAVQFASELSELIRGRRLYLLQNILEPTSDEDKEFHNCSIFKTSDVLWDYEQKEKTEGAGAFKKVPVYKKLLYLLVQSKYKIPFARNKEKIESALLGFEVGDVNSEDFGLLREIRVANEEITGTGTSAERKQTHMLIRLKNYKTMDTFGGRKVKIPFTIIAYDTSGMVHQKKIIPDKTRIIFEGKVISELRNYAYNNSGILRTGINILPMDKSRSNIFSKERWD